jgi:hypothetical protein
MGRRRRPTITITTIITTIAGGTYKTAITGTMARGSFVLARITIITIITTIISDPGDATGAFAGRPSLSRLQVL